MDYRPEASRSGKTYTAIEVFKLMLKAIGHHPVLLVSAKDRRVGNLVIRADFAVKHLQRDSKGQEPQGATGQPAREGCHNKVQADSLT